LLVYICIAVGYQIVKWEGWDHINQFKTVIHVYRSQAGQCGPNTRPATVVPALVAKCKGERKEEEDVNEEQ
jgi:hypothetical protein